MRQFFSRLTMSFAVAMATSVGIATLFLAFVALVRVFELVQRHGVNNNYAIAVIIVLVSWVLAFIVKPWEK